MLGSSPSQLFYGVDQIGSVRRVFASPTNAPAYGYNPYGLPLQPTAPLTDFGYAGLINEPDSGLGDGYRGIQSEKKEMHGQLTEVSPDSTNSMRIPASKIRII